MKDYKAVLVVWIVLATSCASPVNKENAIRTMQELLDNESLVVRFARLEIDSARLDEYLVFLKEGIETSIATEPGVLTMYGVQEQADPTKVTMLEIYLNDSAYQSHLNTAHFQRYKTGTLEMVRSLELVDLDPIVFGVRTND